MLNDIFMGLNNTLTRFFGALEILAEDFLVQMILKQDKVVQLHLETFSSGNLTHFHLERKISNRNRTIYEGGGKNQTRTE
jgi:hypothetical protein